MDNNTAFRATLGNITKIEGADKIVQASVMLSGLPITQVVVGVDTKEGTEIVYFDSNMCLSDAFLADNPEMKNYLAKGNRVRCIKLKGVISNGLAVDIGKFSKYSKDIPSSFTSLGSTEICRKWLPEAVNVQPRGNKISKTKNAKKPSRIIPELFHFHIDTQQLMRNLHKINPSDVISISRKIHGTSAICGYLPVKRNLSFIEKIASKFGVEVVKTKYDYVYASRTVIKNSDEDAVHTDLWSTVGSTLFAGKLNRGEAVYYEIVGYMPGTSTFIQKNYDYGCKPGEYKVAIYRITQTNEDGVVFEYGWAAMKERCTELNVPMVEEYYFGKAYDHFLLGTDSDDLAAWRVGFVQELRQMYLEKDARDNLCKKVPDEGIVLRVEAKDITVFKLKSERFFLNESSSKDAGEIDIEEQESVAE